MLSEALITSFQTVASSLSQLVSQSTNCLQWFFVCHCSFYCIRNPVRCSFALDSVPPARCAASRQVLLLRQLDGVLINCSINLMFSSCLLLIFFILVRHAPIHCLFFFASLPGETRVQPSLRCPKCQLSVHFQWALCLAKCQSTMSAAP